MRDLRVSVIDACNFRCSYCMPADNRYHFLARNERLSVEETTRLVRLFVSLGVRKIRLTGGEPLLRKELTEIVAGIRAIPGIKDVALSTNGYHLAERAAELKAAGLQRVTVSMDGIDRDSYATASGVNADINRVLRGVEEAVRVGLWPVKLNVVVQRGVNEHTVPELVEYARGEGYILRFIEYMDVGTLNDWKQDEVVSSGEILAAIRTRYDLQPADPNYFGEVASRYVFADGEGEVGFISSVTQPFCQKCTRARLSSYGSLYTCLFASKGVDLRGLLRNGASDDEIVDAIRTTWEQRTDRYSEERAAMQPKERKREKVQMYSIGG